ncbi:MAG: protein translocase subunit SecD [Methylophilaceae bacterium]|nr:protein translocase subunit SecD [Methylophilaceae bacterium]MDG1445056.1 protein translocase subunit SecD [Methylophilaceae bacterium]MDG1820581.1 protein translocase subunit SecD [Methylophilaceae bacterium]
MNRYPTWKYILIAASIMIGLLYTIPNLFGESPAVQISPARASLKADQALLGKVEAALDLAGIAFDGIYLDASGVKVRFKNPEDQLKAKDRLNENLGNDYTVALNLLSQTPDWLLAIGAKPMYLGLDLRGGVHFLLQVDMDAALTKSVESSVGDFRSAMRNEKINYRGVSRNKLAINVGFENETETEKARRFLATTYPDFTYTVDGGGTAYTLVATLSPTAQKQVQEFALKQNLLTLHNRINELGVAEPIVQQQGLDRIVVQLPGVQDTAKAKEILGRTAALEVRMVTGHGSRSDARDFDPKKTEDAVKGIIPAGSELLYSRIGEPLLVSKRVVFSGENLVSASPKPSQQGSGAEIAVSLDSKGAGSMKLTTREGINRRMAVILVEKGKKEVLTAPTVQAELSSQFVITGMANLEEANDLALLMRAGALAAPMEIVEERTVGPSMGEENIKSGVHSTLWGFAAIAVMMMLYYMLFGVISVTALAINLLLLVALLSMLQATLTLPGLAAIALALGMAIDANVLINERIREELRDGNTPQASIRIGYDKAFGTIMDSNITTLIAGAALFMFGTGPIKGFAVVHVLGILTSMFSAVTVSRGIVNLVYGYRRKIDQLSIGQI